MNRTDNDDRGIAERAKRHAPGTSQLAPRARKGSIEQFSLPFSPDFSFVPTKGSLCFISDYHCDDHHAFKQSRRN